MTRVIPRAAPRPCSAGGCSTLVYDHSGRCARHVREPWTKQTAKPVKRITGRRLQTLRHQLFRDHPLCRQCEREGRFRRATVRDHVIPLAEGGTDEPDNIQGLCDECHELKSARESARGRVGGSKVREMGAGTRLLNQKFTGAKLGRGGSEGDR